MLTNRFSKRALTNRFSRRALSDAVAVPAIEMLTGGAISGDVTFTRNSIGWDWELSQYAIDTPRYYGGGLIVEKQQTNRAIRLDYWTTYSNAYNITLAQQDPAGGTNAALVTNSGSQNQRQRNFSTGLDEIPLYGAHTVLARIDAAHVGQTVNLRYYRRNLSATGGVVPAINFAIDTGALSNPIDGFFDSQTIGTDWVLIRGIADELSKDITGQSWASPGIFSLGSGVSVRIAGFTCAENAASTPIVTTGSSPVTRAADYVSQDLSSVVTDTHQVHLDVELAWGIGAAGELGEYQVIESMDDGSGNEGVEIVRYGDGTIRLRVIDGGVVTVDQSLGTVTHGQRLKIWRGFHNGTHYAQIEGGTLVQAAAAMPSGRVERIGNRGHTDGAEHAQSCATHYTHVVYPDTLSVLKGQAFIA